MTAVWYRGRAPTAAIRRPADLPTLPPHVPTSPLSTTRGPLFASCPSLRTPPRQASEAPPPQRTASPWLGAERWARLGASLSPMSSFLYTPPAKLRLLATTLSRRTMRSSLWLIWELLRDANAALPCHAALTLRCHLLSLFLLKHPSLFPPPVTHPSLLSLSRSPQLSKDSRSTRPQGHPNPHLPISEAAADRRDSSGGAPRRDGGKPQPRRPLLQRAAQRARIPPQALPARQRRLPQRSAPTRLP